MNTSFRRFLIGLAVVGFAGVAGSSSAGEPNDRTHVGRSSVYGDISDDSLEDVSTEDAIKGLFGDGGAAIKAPTRIWSVLEHGEKVECLSCIPLVGELIYDSNPKTREISAWWLRRRIFGVFGEGQVYSQIVDTLKDSENSSETQRVYAANAIGEFLVGAGVKHVAASVLNDPSPAVRAASATALERLNTQGPSGEIASAMGDGDASVRLAALHAAQHVNVFTHTDAVLALIGDESDMVRRTAVEALGSMRVGDAVGGLVALSSPETESDPSVRQRAVWALGQIADEAGKDAVTAALQDPDGFVRDAAAVSLRRL